MRATILPKSLVCAATALSLAACGDADKGPKTVEQAKQEAQELQRPEPGEYRQSTRITKFDVPGAPKEMIAQLRTMIEGQNDNKTFCLSKGEADKGFEEFFKKGRDGDCTYDRFDASANTLDAIMICTDPSGATMRMAINGTVTATGSKVKVDVAQKNDKSPMGNANMAMEMETKRLGECPGAGAK